MALIGALLSESKVLCVYGGYLCSATSLYSLSFMQDCFVVAKLLLHLCLSLPFPPRSKREGLDKEMFA